MSRLILIPISVDENATLIRLSNSRPLALRFGTGGVALDVAQSPWAVTILLRLRGLVFEDGAGI